MLSTSGDRNTIKGTLRGYFGKDVLEFEVGSICSIM